MSPKALLLLLPKRQDGWAARRQELPTQAELRAEGTEHQATVLQRLVGNPVQVFLTNKTNFRLSIHNI